jgi:hypothetical protein
MLKIKVMKNIVFLLFFLSALGANAQDIAFLQTLNAVKSQDDAKAAATAMAAQVKGKFVFYKIREFDNGLLRIVFIPQGMTEADVKAQADYEDCFVTDFKPVTDANGRTYRLDKAKAKYDALFPLWQHYFKADAKPDKKTQRYTDPDKTMLFSFLNLGEVWAIGR